MKYEIVQHEIFGTWFIVIGNWEDQITEDHNLDPFETEEDALKYAQENL